MREGVRDGLQVEEAGLVRGAVRGELLGEVVFGDGEGWAEVRRQGETEYKT